MQNRPRDRDPLPLAARQRVPPLAHHGVVAVLELADEVVGVRRPRRRDRLLQRRLGQPVADVLQDRAVEQVRVLEHHPHLPPVVAGLQQPHVHAVDADRAARDVVEPRDQVRDRRLAAPRRAHQADQLTRRDIEAHTAQHLADAVIGERHVLERHPARQRLEPHRLRRILNLRLGVQHLEYAMRRRRGAAHRPCHLADHFDRRHEHRGVEQERDERSRRQRRAAAQQARHRERPHAERGRVHAEHQERPERGPEPVDAVELPGHVLVALAEARDLPVLLVERLHDPDARNRVGEHVGDARPLAPRPQEQLLDRLAVPVDQPAKHRHRDRHDQAEPPVEREQHGAEAREHHQRQRHVHDAERQELPEAVGIGRDARDQASRPFT